MNGEIKEMMDCITASDEKIAFCFKLWVKELIESPNKSRAKTWIINHALNEILDGSYCSDEEFKNKDKIFPQGEKLNV